LIEQEAQRRIGENYDDTDDQDGNGRR
jgi:hypothetical protein